jgi:hypothetical protein
MAYVFDDYDFQECLKCKQLRMDHPKSPFVLGYCHKCVWKYSLSVLLMEKK